MKSIEKVIGAIVVIATIVAACAGIIQLIPSFGAWLYPRTPQDTNLPTNIAVTITSSTEQLQTADGNNDANATQAISNPALNLQAPIIIENVLSDVPGTPLEPGIEIISIVDQDTKPRDVYAIELTAGQTAYVSIETDQAIEVYMEKPGFSTFESSKGIYLGIGGSPNSFIAAITGAYYLAVYPYGNVYTNGTKYQISVTVDSGVISQVLSDVPGTKLEPGMLITSVVDRDTKPRDVYAIDLVAGQTAYISIETDQAIQAYMEKPGFSTFESSKGIYLGINGPPVSFIAATTGTYYVAVYPNGVNAYTNGDKYIIKLTIAD